jgi:hypothetical protein
MRVAKGWLPSHCVTFMEKAAYTFGHAKVGRGDRLVVLAASKLSVKALNCSAFVNYCVQRFFSYRGQSDS